MTDLVIYEEIIGLTRAGVPFALATVVTSKGSSPRKAGAKMLVHEDGSTLGTVGGGRVEAETVQSALAAIGSGAPLLLTFVLTEAHNFVCGGSLDIYVEPYPVAPRLVMFGAGHVGKAVTGLAKASGFRVAVVDERSEMANRGNLPDADEILCCPVAEAFATLTITAETLIVVATTGHELDFQTVRGALDTPAAFIGLLGSKRKYGVLMETLEQEGVPAGKRERIVSPVGLCIGAETPAEIAVSIVGQLIQRRRCHAATGIGDSPRRRPVEADGALQAASPA
jgi:xanthine dehydrogenase accessory factor